MSEFQYPKISIVTPSYNQGKFLEETLLSVLNQNYPNLEYMVIDGGSTDNSVDIIKRYSDRLTYWVSEKDHGQGDAIRKGFDRATGDIYCWLNSDDILYAGALHRMASMFVRWPNVGFIYADRHKIDSQSKVISTMRYQLYVPGQFRFRNPVAQEAAFWTAKAYHDAGGIDITYKFCMDYDLWCRLAAVTRVKHIPYILGGFRQHGESKTHTIRHISGQEKNQIRKKYYGQVPGRFKTFCFSVFMAVLKGMVVLAGINKLRRFIYDRK